LAVKLLTPITATQIKLFRGTVDFYYWKGIPVARKWPRTPKLPTSPEYMATQQAFKDSHTWRRSLPAPWHTLFESIPTTRATPLTDYLKRIALIQAYGEGPLPP
jgi:hypothetical protein